VVVALVYQLGWLPLQDRGRRAAEQLEITEAGLQRLETLASLNVTARRPVPSGPLLDRVSRHAERHGLGLRQLVPIGSGLQVTTGDVGFGDMLSWLAAVTEDEAVRITSVQLSRQPAPGIITAQLELMEAQ
jgi:type II secretory pathway component PulM